MRLDMSTDQFHPRGKSFDFSLYRLLHINRMLSLALSLFTPSSMTHQNMKHCLILGEMSMDIHMRSWSMAT